MDRRYQDIVITILGVLSILMLCVIYQQLKTSDNLEKIVDFIEDIESVEVL